MNGEWSHWNHKTIPHWVASINKDYPQKEHIPPDDIASRFYPSLGPYSSSDPLVIQEHMKQLRKAGVGVIAVSWYPPQSKDPNAIIFVDELMPSILDIANDHGIKVCFHIEPYTDRSALSVKRDIEYIINTYSFRSLLRIDMDHILLSTVMRIFRLCIFMIHISLMVPNGQLSSHPKGNTQ